MPRRRLLIALWALIWVAYGVWAWRAGVRLGVDTPLYSRWADRLLALDFNFSAFLQAQDFYVSSIVYIGWITAVAVAKRLAGDSWMTAIVLFNWIAFGAGSYAVLTAVRRITSSAVSLLLAAGLFFVATDLVIFIPFVLSDVIFWGMTSVVLAAGCVLATARLPWRDAALITIGGSLLVVGIVLFRPAGLTVLPFWAAALACALLADRTTPLLTPATLTVCILALVAVGWHSAAMANPDAWPFDSLRGIIDVVSARYHRGFLVEGPEADIIVTPAVTAFGALRLTSTKLLYFITPWLPAYSAAHTVMNLAFFIPGYGLSIAAIARRHRLSDVQQRVALIVLLFAVSTTLFCALMGIDYDHRYRMPVLSALIILAALGLESLRRPTRLG